MVGATAGFRADLDVSRALGARDRCVVVVLLTRAAARRRLARRAPRQAERRAGGALWGQLSRRAPRARQLARNSDDCRRSVVRDAQELSTRARSALAARAVCARAAAFHPWLRLLPHPSVGDAALSLGGCRLHG